MGQTNKTQRRREHDPLYEDSSSGKKQPDFKMEKLEEILTNQRCIQWLEHACQCRNANCSLPYCRSGKLVVLHTEDCKGWKTNDGCPLCDELTALCYDHAKHCQDDNCPRPFCDVNRFQQRLQRVQRRLQQARMMRQLMATPPHGG